MKHFFILISIAFSLHAKAAIESPILEFDPSKYEATKSWALNAKISLERLQKTLARTPLEDHSSYYIKGIEQVLQESRASNESLMRFILTRAQAFYKVLENDLPGPKKDFLLRRFLAEHVAQAIEVYQVDENIFERQATKKLNIQPIEFASLAYLYVQFVDNYYYSITSNQTRLEFNKLNMLIWLNDIQRDPALNRVLAPVSAKLAMYYEVLSKKNPTDNIETLLLSRQVRSFLMDEISLSSKIFEDYKISIDSFSSMLKQIENYKFQKKKKTDKSNYLHFPASQSYNPYANIVKNLKIYPTHFDGECATNYLEGELVITGGKKNILCIEKHPELKSYVTSIYASNCDQDFIPSISFGNKKICLRKDSLPDTFIVNPNISCGKEHYAGMYIRPHIQSTIKRDTSVETYLTDRKIRIYSKTFEENIHFLNYDFKSPYFYSITEYSEEYPENLRSWNYQYDTINPGLLKMCHKSLPYKTAKARIIRFEHLGCFKNYIEGIKLKNKDGVESIECIKKTELE